jgi:hypothetical protein
VTTIAVLALAAGGGGVGMCVFGAYVVAGRLGQDSTEIGEADW